jgi:hypothetical protein
MRKGRFMRPFLIMLSSHTGLGAVKK